ncbi:unnamed protein product [marine sediment metagenome]|uniref:Uncharacterized protein n=1 Tax=marine sediment metagenome TaxID=412755 RepID=X1FGC7_9ZZZZ
MQEELTTELIKARPLEHSKEIKAKLEPIPMEPIKTIAKNDKVEVSLTIKSILNTFFFTIV